MHHRGPDRAPDPTFNQLQVQPALDLGFANGVRAMLRQDPDIIMIGEIRDRETALVAVQAALTGHLVLSTLHTNDACGAITRLQELGVADYLIKATLVGVMAQRLVRTLCADCRVVQRCPKASRAVPVVARGSMAAQGCSSCWCPATACAP